jgi:hypothetical protein
MVDKTSNNDNKKKNGNRTRSNRKRGGRKGKRRSRKNKDDGRNDVNQVSLEDKSNERKVEDMKGLLQMLINS